MSEDDDSVLRRQAAAYRDAADHYETGARQLRLMADEIEARNYKAEAPPPGWIAQRQADDPWQQPDSATTEEDEDDEFKMVVVRKAAANDIFGLLDEVYVGTLEDKGFTYDQCEEIYEFFQEIIGAYKLEFDWGCSFWVDGRGSSHTSFSYTDFKYDDPDAKTVWWDDPPVIIKFDIDDMRRAVRQCATSYDDTTDGSAIEMRREVLQILRIWCDCINTLIIEVEEGL